MGRVIYGCCVEKLVVIAEGEAGLLGHGNNNSSNAAPPPELPVLPSDYVALMSSIGPHAWLEHVGIYSPKSPREQMTRLQIDFREDFHSLCELGMVPKEHRYPVYPDCGGILCVGGNDNGCYIGWLTQGDTDNWPVVLVSDDGCDVEVHQLTLSCFLLGWLNGDIISKVLLPASLLRSRRRILFRRVPYVQ